jgi:hypothetical protein
VEAELLVRPSCEARVRSTLLSEVVLSSELRRNLLLEMLYAPFPNPLIPTPFIAHSPNPKPIIGLFY